MWSLVVNTLLIGLSEAIRSQYIPGAYLVEFLDSLVRLIILTLNSALTSCVGCSNFQHEPQD
jgi:hypothetical protein